MKQFRRPLLIATILSTVAASPAFATPAGEWDGEAGADTNFSTDLNWAGDTIPGDNDTLLFGVDGPLVNNVLNNDISLTDIEMRFYEDFTIGGNAFVGDMSGVAIYTDSGANVTFDTDFDLNGSNLDTYGYSGESITINGDISGTGSIVQTNTIGTMILNGMNTYTGDTNVTDSSTLVIGDHLNTGASITSNVEVYSTLRGNGTIHGNVMNNASDVTPGSDGNSIGRLTVDGNYTQTSGSNLNFNISDSGNSSLNVTGAALIDGTINITYESGTYRPGNTSYRVLTASDIDYTSSIVESDPPPAHTDGGEYVIKVVKTSSYMDVLMLREGYADNPEMVIAPVTVTMQASQHNITTVLDRINAIVAQSGSYHTAQIEPFQIAFGGTDDQLRGVVPSGKVKRGVWFRALGSMGDMDDSGGLPGYETTTGGFVAGLDTPVGDKAVLGITGGYTTTDIDGNANSGKADVSTPRVGIYGSYDIGLANIAATVGYARSNIDSQRQTVGGIANGDHDQNEYSAGLQASKLLSHNGYSIIPRAGVQYAHIESGSYLETGPGINAGVLSDSTDSLQPFVGASVARSFSHSGIGLTPQVRASYRYEVLDTTRATQIFATNSGGIATGINAARNIASLGAGLGAEFSKTLTGYVSYDADLYLSKGQEHTFQLGAKYRF